MNLETANHQIPVETNINSGASSENLSRRVFAEPRAGQGESLGQSAEAGFRPSSDDIDYFLKNEFKGEGLTRNDLTRIAEQAKTQWRFAKRQNRGL